MRSCLLLQNSIFGILSGLHMPSFITAKRCSWGILGGSLSLAILFGFRPLTFPLFLIAAIAAANYFVAMVFAPFIPGTGWTDPEFAAETGHPLALSPVNAGRPVGR